jgi:hypothetical protein
MKKAAFLLIWFFTLTTVGAQTMTRLSGVILDKVTKSPVAYAAIGIVGKQIGTVANAEGNFLFNTGANSLNDTIIITGLGYYPFRAVIRELVKERPLIIELTPQVYNLQEVQIKTRKMTALEVMTKATKKFKDNIDCNPYLMNAYYREILKEDSTFVMVAEAASTIYQLYSEKYNFSPKIKINALRTSENQQRKDYLLNNKINVTIPLALSSDAMLPEGRLKKHEFIIDSFCMYNGRLVYIISLNETSKCNYIYKYEFIENKATGEMEERLVDSVPNKSIYNTKASYYVDALTFAFIRMDYIETTVFNEFSDNPLFNNYFEVDGKNCLLDFHSIHCFVEYKQIGRSWYPSHFFNNVEQWYYDIDTKKTVLKASIYSEFFVNEIVTDNVTDIPAEEIYHEEHSILTLQLPFDEEFWKNYNYIPDDSLRRIAFRDLEKLRNK